ncbi:uncharacterized protein DS421_13g403090 [Arachis hypogaea]|nr:uncharacterized protein DS421_13g403090 [Arachis hypogaea]
MKYNWIRCIVDGLADGVYNFKEGVVSSLNGGIYVLQGLVGSKEEQPVPKRPVRPKKSVVKEATEVEKEQSWNEKKTHSPSMPTFDFGVEFPLTPPAPPTPLTAMTLDSIDVPTQQVLGSKIPCLNQTTDVPIGVSEPIVEKLVLDANMTEKLYEHGIFEPNTCWVGTSIESKVIVVRGVGGAGGVRGNSTPRLKVGIDGECVFFSFRLWIMHGKARM